MIGRLLIQYLPDKTFIQRVSNNETFGSTSGLNNWTFNDLSFENASTSNITITTNAGTGDIVVSATTTIGNTGDSNTTTLKNDTNDRTLDLNGNLLITSKGTLLSSGTSTLYISGNYTNNGTFTANSGTTTFDGTNQQTLSGTMTGTSPFYTLNITNNSGTDPDTDPSLIFTNAASSTSLYVTTASTKLRFQADKGYTFTNLHLNGLNTATRVQLRSSTPSTPWKLYVTGDQSVLNTDAKDSDASGGNEIDATDSSNLDSTGNTNWDFGGDFLSMSLSTNSISFGTLNSDSVRFASSTAQGDTVETIAHTLTASTTAGTGYTITVRGNTLKSGNKAITGIGNSCASSTNGTEQFGIRMTSSGGSGQVSSPYSALTSYAYGATATTTDVVATTGGVSVDTTYSVYYMSNIHFLTEAGDYTTNITYVITGNF